MSVGRNDPCPCGSGLKYKKCCAKKDDVKKRVEERLKNPDEVLAPDASIYKVWLEWRAARRRSDFNFLYDLVEPGTPLAGAVGERDAFVAACADGSARVPHGEPAHFKHLRIVDGAQAHLLQTLGDEDSAMSKVVCERIGFTLTERGWRMTEFDLREIRKEGDEAIGLALFEG